MSNLFLSQILNYEEQVFNRFVTNRTNLLNLVKTIKLEDFDKQQLLNFVKSMKNVTESTKSCNKFITEFRDNFLQNNFIKLPDDNIENDFIQFYFLFKDFFFTTTTSSSSDEDDDESSEISLSSLSSLSPLDSLDSE